MKKIPSAALLALVGAGLAAQSASAATTAWNPDDLFLGFYTTGTQGSGSNILIDLGQAPLYRDDNVAVLGSQTSIIGINVGSLLNSTFETGGQWYNDTNLRWGLTAWSGTSSVVSGGHTDFSNTLYISNPETNPTPPASAVAGIQSGAGSDIQTMASTGTNAFAGQTTNNGFLNGILYSSANDSWAAHAANSFGGDATQYGSFQTAPSLTSALDLYRLTRSGGNAQSVDGLRGTFTIDNSGQVFYSAPTPEPTSIALLGGAGLLFLVRSRRRLAQA